MKKILAVASLATIGFATTAFIAPKISTGGTFEGIVTYSLSVDDPQIAPFVGSAVTVYIKGDKSKSVSDGMTKRITFTDYSKVDDPIVLMEMAGNKYQLKSDKPKKTTDDKAPDIKYTDETKTIAGYTCHKAVITTTDDQGQASTANLYYTTDIVVNPPKSGDFVGLKGFPMEFSKMTQGKTISMSVTKVEKKSISDDTFTVPSGYKLMTMQEIMADVQKNMGGGN